MSRYQTPQALRRALEDLRNQHSANMAQRVSFDTAPQEKILPLQRAQAS